MCLLCKIFIFSHRMKIVVGMVTEIVKMSQKDMDPDITKKTIQVSLMKLDM